MRLSLFWLLVMSCMRVSLTTSEVDFVVPDQLIILDNKILDMTIKEHIQTSEGVPQFEGPPILLGCSLCLYLLLNPVYQIRLRVNSNSLHQFFQNKTQITMNEWYCKKHACHHLHACICFLCTRRSNRI